MVKGRIEVVASLHEYSLHELDVPQISIELQEQPARELHNFSLPIIIGEIYVSIEHPYPFM